MNEIADEIDDSWSPVANTLTKMWSQCQEEVTRFTPLAPSCDQPAAQPPLSLLLLSVLARFR